MQHGNRKCLHCVSALRVRTACPHRVRGVLVRPGADERPHALHAALRGRGVQGRLPRLAPGALVGACLHQLGEAAEVAPSRRKVQRGEAVLRVGWGGWGGVQCG